MASSCPPFVVRHGTVRRPRLGHRTGGRLRGNRKGLRGHRRIPGLDEKNIEVKYADGVLTIKGEKHEEKDEKQKDYHMHERTFSFHRALQLPNGIDPDKIEASFTKGVLKVTLPMSTEAQKADKKIAIKAA